MLACAACAATAVSSAAQKPSVPPPSADFEPLTEGDPTQPDAEPAVAPSPTAPPPASSPPTPVPGDASGAQPATAPPAVAPAPTQPAVQPAPAAAYPPPPPAYYPPAAPVAAPFASPEPERNVSFTISPLLLMFPMLELGAELRVLDGFGVSARGGLGNWGVTLPDDKKDVYPAWRLGGQVHWYLMRPFGGLEVGAELGYLRVETDEPEFPWDSLKLRRLTVGTFIGYKLLVRVGFTFQAQFGIVRAFEKVQAQSEVLTTVTDEDSRWDALLNVGLGWSF
jgi:hypothetical protein